MNSFFKLTNKILSQLKNGYKHLSTWGKVVMFILVIIVLISCFKQTASSSIEGFIQKETFVHKSGLDVYDEFYADIYDYLVFSDVKNEYEIGQIINKTSPTSESIILDVGSGTGHHVGTLGASNFDIVGLDISDAMIKKAQENYPKSKFVKGDVNTSDIFAPSTFTHILCLYFTIYYLKDKKTFFENSFNWLKPGGYLIIHLVNKDMFDPILPPGNPLLLVSPQKYAKKRITTTKVKFTDFAYNSEFKLDENSDIAYFIEKFKKDGQNQSRKNEHIFYMDSQKTILTMAQEAGFILEAQADLIQSQYEYQYLYFLTKPS